LICLSIAGAVRTDRGVVSPGFSLVGPDVPRFLFHICKEDLTLAAVAEELPGKSMAITTARRMARELLADTEGEWISARIADEHGDLVGVIHMSDYWRQ
jgi:hypothetical protein